MYSAVRFLRRSRPSQRRRVSRTSNAPAAPQDRDGSGAGSVDAINHDNPSGASIGLCFRCSSSNQFVEAFFKLSDRVSDVKERIAPSFSIQKDQIDLVFQNETLQDGSELVKVFKRGGLLRDVIEVRVSQDRQSDIGTVSSTQCSLRLAIRTILEDRPTNEVVDEIHKLLPPGVERSLLVTIFASTLETKSDTNDQAQFLTTKIQEIGLDLPAIEAHESDVFTNCYSNQSYETEGDETERILTCPACFEDIPESQTICFFCSFDQAVEQPHFLCLDCAGNYVKSKLEAREPRIKCFERGCKHFLMPQEIALVLGNGDASAGMKDPEFQEIDELQRDFAITKDPQDFASCPSESCSWTIARSARGAIEKAICPQCNLSFCTNCNDIYHYRTSCTQWREKARVWQDWKASGRAEYWKRDAKLSRKARQAAKAEQKRVKQVRDVEAKDEKYKADNCRYCPNCNRLVERLEGCSIMRCGYDTDTKANRQPGCLEKFDWNSARRYQPSEVGKNVKLSIPDVSNKIEHTGESCDHCGAANIKGLRFVCVNCPFYTLCEKCEADASSNHGPRHVFDIKLKPG